MIGWQHPGAFWALPLMAIPVVIHLLRMHPADRVLFPSLRFVQPSRTSATRLRMPSDWLLLLLRMTAIGGAVCALAGPILVTEGRVATWNNRVARAIVVDTSESMRLPGEDGATPERLAAAAAEDELRRAAFGRRFNTRDIDAGMTQAGAWLLGVPPAQREIVVISDFSLGSFDERSRSVVPDGVGLRLVSVGRPSARRVVPGAELLESNGGLARNQTIELTVDSTRVTVDSRAQRAGEGLRVVVEPQTPGEASRVDSLMRVLAHAGSPAGSAAQPIVIHFGAEVPASLAPIRSLWMLRTLLRLREDRALSSAASSTVSPFSASQATRDADPWTIVARDRDRKALVRAAASGSELFLDVGAQPESLFAATAVRSALLARSAANDQSEYEVATIDPNQLAVWGRKPDRAGNWSTAESTDARWIWASVLVLLGIEHWLRTRPARLTRQEPTRVAA
jgi:hypothetical protein